MTARDTRTAQKMVGASVDLHGDGKKRPASDFYVSPRIATVRLLETEHFDGLIWEPCCGNGAISKVLVEYGHDVLSSDLHNWGYGIDGVDFLATQYPRQVQRRLGQVRAVVTNPPFGLATQIVERALDHASRAMFLNRLVWLEGKKRWDKLAPWLQKVHVFKTRIPRTHRFDYTGRKGTSLIAFAWFVFGHKRASAPVINWILGGRDE